MLVVGKPTKKNSIKTKDKKLDIKKKSFMNKEYCKNLIGQNVYDIRHNNRKGTLKKIQFSNKSYSVCWFLFQYNNGAYLLSLDDITIINKQTRLNL